MHTHTIISFAVCRLQINKVVKVIQARIAQLVEQLICNHQVAGSTPVPSSILL